MNKTEGLFLKGLVWLMVPVLLVAGATSCTCGTDAADTTTGTAYKLTHSAADAEYILGWDTIVSVCPDIGDCDKQEDFIHRGESEQSSAGGTSSIEMDSPGAWMSMRLAMTDTTGGSFRGFGVYISYFDTEEYLYEQMGSAQMTGLPFQEEANY